MAEMQILSCYTSVCPPARWAMAAHAPEAQTVDVRNSPFAYWHEISKRWGQGTDLVTIEHDIEIHENVMPTFRSCTGLWCVFPYEIHERGQWLDFGMGCTRFRAEAQTLVSTETISSKPGSCFICKGEPGCWMHIDCKIYWAMTEAGIERCVHWPEVTHHGVRGEPKEEKRWHKIAPLEASGD